MVRLGWREGAPPGRQVFGAAMNRNRVTATIGVHPFQRDRGQIQMYGECRDMEHKVVDGQSSDIDITDQLRAG